VESALSLNDAIPDATEVEPTGVKLAELLTEPEIDWLLLGSAIGVGATLAELIETLLLGTMADETLAD
jgi:hypothetical protein